MNTTNHIIYHVPNTDTILDMRAVPESPSIDRTAYIELRAAAFVKLSQEIRAAGGYKNPLVNGEFHASARNLEVVAEEVFQRGEPRLLCNDIVGFMLGIDEKIWEMNGRWLTIRLLRAGTGWRPGTETQIGIGGLRSL